jgi:hypothetical protein
MNRTNLKLTASATLTGLLLLAAGSLMGISSVAADGPEVQTPGALPVGMAEGNGAAAAQDLLQTSASQSTTTYATYVVANCTQGGPSGMLICAPVQTAAVATAAMQPVAAATDPNDDAQRRLSFDRIPSVDGQTLANAAH